jgi:hypothetical protein
MAPPGWRNDYLVGSHPGRGYLRFFIFLHLSRGADRHSGTAFRYKRCCAGPDLGAEETGATARTGLFRRCLSASLSVICWLGAVLVRLSPAFGRRLHLGRSDCLDPQNCQAALNTGIRRTRSHRAASTVHVLADFLKAI